MKLQIIKKLFDKTKEDIDFIKALIINDKNFHTIEAFRKKQIEDIYKEFYEKVGELLYGSK